MKKIGIGIVLVLLYGFPFVYFAMKQDFTHRSMIGYLIMIVATAILALLAQYFCNGVPFVIGNLLSIIMSFYFNGSMSDVEMWDGGYFKPFTPGLLIVVVSVLNLIPQYIAVVVARKFHHVNKS